MKNAIQFLYLLFSFGVLNNMIAQGVRLDSSFATGGKLVTALGPDTYYALDMAIQPDGKIIVVGFRLGSNQQNAINLRFNPDGALDNTYAGSYFQNLWGPSEAINTVAIQPDGKIILGGYGKKNTGDMDRDFTVARLLPNGGLDVTFSANGTNSTSFYSNFTSNEAVNSVAVQADGKIVAVGKTSNNSSDYRVGFALFNNTEVTQKLIASNELGNAAGNSVVIQPDGKILVAGIARPSNNHGQFFIVRLNANLQLDNDFGTGGIVTTDVSSGTNVINEIILQLDGKIVAAGKSSNEKITLARYNADGSLDNSFGTAGIKISDITNAGFNPITMALQTDGKFIVSGTALNDSTSTDFLLARFNNDGALDTSFGIGGKVIIDLFDSEDYLRTVAIQPDGKIMAAGISYGGINTNLALVRYLSDLKVGVLDFSSAFDQVLIYPNPVTESAMLEYTLSKEEKISIQLLDMQGRTLMNIINNQRQAEGNYQQLIDLPENLAFGDYFIVLSTANEGRISIKIVK